ncbi:universal stress protein [Phytohabitans suffuscus]|uniref:Universal stress protein n=1 Tax=Phytohabitans suffuscus TaxID=624315 RepID=A0A6F8YVA6_9ACTN|nr:universal stress protein [Phytohabitans suffuscus]BCB90052.1 universal stress protein [Phytohabitans suffuscus]
MPTLPIVVGYDGSGDADAALRWALDDSARTGKPVSVVCGFELRPVPAPIGLAPTVWPDDTGRDEAEAAVAEATAKARRTRPDVRVSGSVIDGPATAGLVSQSRRAAIVVVGSRGQGGFAGLLLGSTSLAVCTHAHCPVVVVRAEPTADGPVVVGFDDSDCARLAVEFGFAQASARGARLHLIHAGSPPAPRSMPPDVDPQQWTRTEQARLSDVVADWRSRYPKVQAAVRVTTGPAAASLIEASRGAQLVVVGSRGRGGLSGMLLGSVSQQLLHHAHSPVAVVRNRSSGNPALE